MPTNVLAVVSTYPMMIHWIEVIGAWSAVVIAGSATLTVVSRWTVSVPRDTMASACQR